MIAGVYLFHLDFCVHIAVVEEVNVRVLHLGYQKNMLTAKISPDSLAFLSNFPTEMSNGALQFSKRTVFMSKFIYE